MHLSSTRAVNTGNETLNAISLFVHWCLATTAKTGSVCMRFQRAVCNGCACHSRTEKRCEE
eukprot:15873-Heterococcus_DN1.PRE.4